MKHKSLKRVDLSNSN